MFRHFASVFGVVQGLSHQGLAVGSRQSFVVDVCLTKALQRRRQPKCPPQKNALSLTKFWSAKHKNQVYSPPFAYDEK